MRSIATAVIATAIASLPGAPMAADALMLPVSTARAVPIAETEFDWNGFYAGVYGVSQISQAGGIPYGLGLDLGVAARFEFVLVGAEVALHGLAGGAGPSTYLQGLGRLGVAATDDVIVYAAAGLGTAIGSAAESDLLLGGGVELALGDQLSLRGQYLHGVPIVGASPKEQVTLGANFHF